MWNGKENAQNISDYWPSPFIQIDFLKLNTFCWSTSEKTGAKLIFYFLISPLIIFVYKI